MKKEFIPYKQSADLKELGFDKFAIGIVGNALYRTDLAAKYGTKNPMVYSNYLTVFYKIN
jgi:hypothetical protein